MNIIQILYTVKGDNMGKFAIIKKLVKIDGECKKDAVLRSKLEPWVERMNNVKLNNKVEALKLSQQLIDEYDRIKKEINDNIARSCNETGSLRKIEQVNER
jgi:hypothetical protein